MRHKHVLRVRISACPNASQKASYSASRLRASARNASRVRDGRAFGAEDRRRDSAKKSSQESRWSAASCKARPSTF